jgi:hypothetical protein
MTPVLSLTQHCLHVASAVQNSHNLYRSGFAPINNEIAANAPKSKRLVRKITTHMTDSRCSSGFPYARKDFVPDSVCQIRVCNFSRIIIPDFDEVRFGGGCE